MTGIRLDNVTYSSLHEAYKNYASESSQLTLGADVLPSGFTQDYPVDALGNYTPMVIPYSRAGTRADVYLIGNGTKVLANASTRLEPGDPYQFKSTETISVFINYIANSINITFEIFNGSASSVTLIPQTIGVLVVEYDAPISPIV